MVSLNDNIIVVVTFLAPFVSAVIISLLNSKISKLASSIAIIGSLCSCLGAIYLFIVKYKGSVILPWFSLPLNNDKVWRVHYGWGIDELSLCMLVVVSLIALLINIYSKGYMDGDSGYVRYFGVMNLFTFAMLGLVIANDLVVLFLFWELVGFCSYLLIGHWYERSSAAEAAYKAILVNKIGDIAFLIGIIILAQTTGTTLINELKELVIISPEKFRGLDSIIGMCIFIGAAAKSAQFPLHIWLPDAMEGPTPVSAFIHGATMVAAGVYLVCRMFFIMNLPGSMVLDFVSYIGLITLVLGGLFAIREDNIKKILAFSTISQLGYMMVSMGVAKYTDNPDPAMYHLVSHAFFKALLFLSVGILLLSCHHVTHNIWELRNIKVGKSIGLFGFLIGALNIIGFPGFIGARSKEGILSIIAANGAPIIFYGTLLGVFLTAFYITRAFVIMMRSTDSSAQIPSFMPSKNMVYPVYLLVAITIGLYWIDITSLHEAGKISSFSLLKWFSLSITTTGVICATITYYNAIEEPLYKWYKWPIHLLNKQFYINDLIHTLAIGLVQLLTQIIRFIDRYFCNFVAITVIPRGIDILARFLRISHNGVIQMYTLAGVLSSVIIILGVIVLLSK